MKKKNGRLRRTIALSLLTGLLITTTGYALPQGGNVVTGGGSISQNGATMTVNQTTNKMGVNWNSFNIAKSETVNFQQPNAASVALNRVVGNDASSIYGSLNANGQVFLINPNGVMFAPGAQVNVGGIVASTHDISNANFLNGKYNFSGTSAASVINQGTINTAAGGYVALLAHNVSNEGTISTPRGSTVLGAGSDMTLSTDATGKVNLAVNQAALNAAAINKGTIKADGGYVVMKAADAADVINSVVTNTGVIEAKSLKNENGEIVLDGGSKGIVNVGGTLNTSAAEANTTGGNITVKGTYTNVNSDAKLYAKATGTQTGGTIETSGDYLYVAPEAIINASSENGKGGTWSLDPLYVTIDNNTSGKAWSATTYKNDSDSAITTHVLASSIQNSLNSGTSVAITAEDKHGVADILVEAPITKSNGGDAQLILKAQREVRIDADIKSTSGKLDMEFHSDSTGNASGAVILNANLDSHGGYIKMGSGSTIEAGTVGTYIGLKESELAALIASDTKTDRNITTLGGNVDIYGNLLLATGDYTNINTVAADGTTGGYVHVSGLIDSGNYYKAVNWTTNLNSIEGHSWADAQKEAYINSTNTTTEGKSALWDSYLATITSNLENSVIESTVNKTNMTTAYFIGGTTNGATSEVRKWYWADGPESGKVFFDQTASGKGTTYFYSNWHADEPNDAGNKQTVATIGYDWNSKWDDNVASNDLKGNTIEMPGYIQETNMLRSALNIKAGSGNVNLDSDIGSQRTLWELDVTNTGSVTTGGSVQLSGDYYQGKQFYSDMNIYSSGKITMQKFVDATGNINIGYDKDGNTISTGAVEADGALTAENGAVAIGSSGNRSASATLKGQILAGTGVAIYTSGDVEADDKIESEGNDVSAIATGGTKPAMSTPKVLGNIIINDSGAESKITLKGTARVDSTDDSKDDITLYGDKMALQGSLLTNLNTGVVTLSNYTSGNTIDLGSTVDTTAKTLELSSDEINKAYASKLVIGNNDAASATKNINITNAIAPTGTSVVHMYTGVAGDDSQIKETTSEGTLKPGLNGILNLAITADTQVYLDNANEITTFAATSTGGTNDSIRLNTTGNNLTVGTVDGVTGVTSDKASDYSAIVLATDKGFINDVGANGVQATGSGSYWRIFSNSPVDDTFGPGAIATYLQSNSYADWQTSYAQGDTVGKQDGGKTNANDNANHYIFKVKKTLVLAPVDVTKNYGDNYETSDHTIGVKDTNYTVLGSIYDNTANATDDTKEVNSQIKSVTLDSTAFQEQAAVGTYSGKPDGLILTVNWNGSAITTTTNGYILATKDGTVKVVPIPLTINLAATRTYGDTKNTTTGLFDTATYTVDNSTTAEGQGLKSWDATAYDAAVNTSAASLKDNTLATTAAKTSYTGSGTYLGLSDTAKTSTVLKNYTITYVDTYTIKKAPLNINLTATRDYGDTTKSGNTFTDVTYTVDNATVAKTNGLKSWDSLAYNSTINNSLKNLNDKTTATTGAKISYTSTDGTYLTLTDAVKAASFLQNYDVSYDDTYTIKKVPLEVTVTGTKVYGDASSTSGSDYNVVLTDASQLKNSETVTNAAGINNTVSKTDNVGLYYNNYTGQTDTGDKLIVTSLTGGNGFNADNYDITYHTKYEVTPAPLTITASSYVLSLGDAIPPLVEKYAGFKNGETAAILNDDGIYTTATSESPLGKYPVDFTGSPNNSNYVITLIPGTIYINPKTPDPHVDPNPPTNPTEPTTPTTPTEPTSPVTNDGTKIPAISGVNDGGDNYGGYDRNGVREAMPVYTVQGTKTTRVGAYDVADSATGVKMHATMDTVADPADDKSESRTTTVKYTKDNLTGTFNVVFDGSIVKVYPEDAASKQMVAETKGQQVS
jgi:filamentous hemagglutinin family protein